jgi:hypothetical protein
MTQQRRAGHNLIHSGLEVLLFGDHFALLCSQSETPSCLAPMTSDLSLFFALILAQIA